MNLPAPTPNQTPEAKLKRLKRISTLLDSAIAIPGTTYRLGLDPVLGLIPGGGDTLGAVLSAYIVLEAMQLKLPRETLIRMVTNLLTDCLLGAIPVAGDLFDVAWKANSRNVALLEGHIANPHKARPADRWFVFLMVIVVIGIVLGVALVATLLIGSILSLLFSSAVG